MIANIIIPIITAVIGAVIGAYANMYLSKRRQIWNRKYELLVQFMEYSYDFTLKEAQAAINAIKGVYYADTKVTEAIINFHEFTTSKPTIFATVKEKEKVDKESNKHIYNIIIAMLDALKIKNKFPEELIEKVFKAGDTREVKQSTNYVIPNSALKFIIHTSDQNKSKLLISALNSYFHENKMDFKILTIEDTQILIVQLNIDKDLSLKLKDVLSQIITQVLPETPFELLASPSTN